MNVHTHTHTNTHTHTHKHTHTYVHTYIIYGSFSFFEDKAIMIRASITSLFASDLMLRSIIKEWKKYHLNGADISNPKYPINMNIIINMWLINYPSFPNFTGEHPVTGVCWWDLSKSLKVEGGSFLGKALIKVEHK